MTVASDSKTIGNGSGIDPQTNRITHIYSHDYRSEASWLACNNVTIIIQPKFLSSQVVEGYTFIKKHDYKLMTVRKRGSSSSVPTTSAYGVRYLCHILSPNSPLQKIIEKQIKLSKCAVHVYIIILFTFVHTCACTFLSSFIFYFLNH